MSPRVPQTDPWKAPDPPRGKRIVVAAFVVGAVVLLALLVGVLLA